MLVGIETADDAAVYLLNENQALIATTDFFMPIVDDPYDFGRIAATNAISDVYAMGGTPIMALGLVGMPINVLPLETIGAILLGGLTGASGRNWESYGTEVSLPAAFAEADKALLSDPQTSGGLLVSCSPDVAAQVLEIFHTQGFAEAAVVGEVRDGQGVSVY